ncbi:MAG: CIA30 family protein [Cyanobacteria bacterium P01_F01_bin.4]
MSEQASSRWNPGRFFETLNFFEAVPVVSWFQQMFFSSPPPPPPALHANVVFDFQQPTEDLRQLWGALDDVVMGGVSASSAQLQPEGMLFTGYVSTENSGGFASVRTRNFEPALNLSTYTGIRLRVRGDGQRYKFFLRDSTAWDSVAYAYSFDTVADEWVEVRIPFADMKPVQRARTIDYRALDSGRIYSLQFMLSKFEYDRALNPHFTPGTFQLLIQSIEVY